MIQTPFQLHVAQWRNCTACPLHIGRKQVVFARGKIPCDILFVGEAPGKSEDMHGQPFYGPAGQLLDDIVENATRMFCVCPHEDCSSTPFTSYHKQDEMTCCPECGRQQSPHPLRCAFTNLVCCLSLGDDNKAVPPEPVSIQACSSRLQDFIAICSPKLIVTVGKLPSEWLDTKRMRGIKLDQNIPKVSIIHPSAILSNTMSIVVKGWNRRKAITTIRNAVEKYIVEGEKPEPEEPIPYPPLLDGDDIPF
jgi:uracil-DNA glycosylase